MAFIQNRRKIVFHDMSFWEDSFPLFSGTMNIVYQFCSTSHFSLEIPSDSQFNNYFANVRYY